jgi:hypothetical protein
VLVQEVIAAIITSPCFKVYSLSLNVNLPVLFTSSYYSPYPLLLTGDVKHFNQSSLISYIVTLSWGNLGPAKVGRTSSKFN